MNVIKYLLTPDGRKQFPAAGAHDHADVARNILKAKGITPKDYADVYHQIFKLDYARVAQFAFKQLVNFRPEDEGKDLLYVENPVHGLTADQIAFLDTERYDHNRVVKFNDKIFETTRSGELNASRIVEVLIGNCHE